MNESIKNSSTHRERKNKETKYYLSEVLQEMEISTQRFLRSILVVILDVFSFQVNLLMTR